MSIQQIFSAFGCLVALLGIIGALKVPLLSSVGPGPGFLPLIYSAAMFLLGVILFFQDKGKKKFNFRASLLTGMGGKAFVFFLLNILMLILLYLFGLVIAMLVFSVLACFTLKRQTQRSIILFSVINTVVFYIVFVVFFKISFQRGLVFRMLGWYL